MGQPPPSPHVGLEVSNVGRLTHGDLALEARVDFLAVVEHRLVPARVMGQASGEGAGLLSGLLPVRIPSMLVMLELVLSV